MIDVKRREASSIDVRFSVPFQHRLRFTDDVFGAQQEVLADLLEPSGGRPARAQFWLDANVAEADPALAPRIRQFSTKAADRFVVVGSPGLTRLPW